MSSKLEDRFCNKYIDQLYAWIDTIPLSRPKRSIARDFADGVLVAEVVAHFVPKLVELHNYSPASSGTQKRVNWQTLNRRVFSKLGMRISDEIVDQVIDSKAGVIEQVLWDIRSKVEQLGYTSYTSEAKLSVNPRSKPSVTQPPHSAQVKRKCSSSSQGPRADEPLLTYRVSNSDHLSSSSRTMPVVQISSGRGSALSQNEPDQVNNDTSNKKDYPIPTSYCNNNETSKSELRKTAAPMSQFNSGFVVTSSTHQTQGYVAPPTIDISSSAQGIGGPVILSPIVDKNENINAGGPPAQIIYRGHKMIPLQFLDEKEKEIKNLETSNRSLTLKIHRLETLVNVKDQRIEDLTHQLQNLRSMYERVTESSYTGGS